MSSTLETAIYTFNETLPRVAESYARRNALGVLVSVDHEGNLLSRYLSKTDKEFFRRNAECINRKLEDNHCRVKDIRDRHIQSARIINTYYGDNDPRSKDLLNEAFPNRKCRLPDGREELLPGSDDLDEHVKNYADPSLETTDEMRVETELVERCIREVITRHRDNLLALREIHVDVCQLVHSFPLLVVRLKDHIIATFREAVDETEESIGVD